MGSRSRFAGFVTPVCAVERQLLPACNQYRLGGGPSHRSRGPSDSAARFLQATKPSELNLNFAIHPLTLIQLAYRSVPPA